MSDKVWTVILAGGGSVRFGGPKALATWRGGTLLSNAIDIASEACCDRVVIVTGGHAERIAAEAAPMQTAYNADWRSGLGSSIGTGARFVLKNDPAAAVLLLLPVDQPFVSAAHLNKLAGEALRRNEIVLTSDSSVTGPPAAIPASRFPLLLELQGDNGLKAVLQDRPLTIEGTGMLRDIDTPEELVRRNP